MNGTIRTLTKIPSSDVHSKILADVGADIAAAEFASDIRREIPKWTAVAKASGARLDSGPPLLAIDNCTIELHRIANKSLKTH